METENESNQIKNKQTSNPELPKRTTVRMALAQIRVLDEKMAKYKETQKQKTEEDLESFKVGTEYNQTNLPSILKFLIEAAESNASSKDLIDTCRKLNMAQIEYINIDDDPLFSNGYHFIFNYDNNEQARLEIIDVRGKLLQSSFQINHKPRLFSSKIKDVFLLIRRFLNDYYTNEFIQKVNGIKIFNFANELSQCYVNKLKVNGKRVLNFRIMNKENWRMINTFGKI